MKTNFFQILWPVIHRQVLLATVKGVWGVIHFQEENSGFVPVLLSLLLNWNRVPAIFIDTPYEARHSQMTGKEWPANLFKLRWNWQQKRATCFVRLTIHESNLSCNKSGFCRLHNAVELLTIFCNNFSQPATIWFVARQVWPMGGINRCCCRSRTQQSGDRTFARHLNNDG